MSKLTDYLSTNADVTTAAKTALVMASMQARLQAPLQKALTPQPSPVHLMVADQHLDYIVPNQPVQPDPDDLTVNGGVRLDQATQALVDDYLNKAIACISDEQVAPDYAQALVALQNNPLLTHPHWFSQLQLTARHRQQVIDYYDLVDATQITKVLYPQWSVSQPEGAINKQAQRGALLSIDTEQGKRYPLQQFDLRARSPSMLAALKHFMTMTADQQLTNLELLHWLCSPIDCTISKADPLFEENIASGDFDAALKSIITAGPSPIQRLIPIEVAQQGDLELFEQLVYQWLSPEPLSLSPVLRDKAIASLKAQMAVLGIQTLSLDK